MKVRDAMTTDVLKVGPEHTLRRAAQLMAERNVGAVVCWDLDRECPGILTERDLLRSTARGEDPDRELVADHLTVDVTTAELGSSLERAADTMISGRFRHLVVLDDDGDLAGMLSMRDIVNAWLRNGMVRVAVGD